MHGYRSVSRISTVTDRAESVMRGSVTPVPLTSTKAALIPIVLQNHGFLKRAVVSHSVSAHKYSKEPTAPLGAWKLHFHVHLLVTPRTLRMPATR